MKRELTQERLKELLSYDKHTGSFTWLVKRSTHINVGEIAGCLAPVGYIQIRLLGALYYGHRLAWLYMTGAWPKEQIDHRNGVKDDNRFHNLRESSGQLNQQNMRGPRRNNKTGFLGVFPARNKFGAHIKIDGKAICLGTYETPELAHAAYVSAKRELHAGCTI